MGHILEPLDSVDPERGLKLSCLRGDSNPDLNLQTGSTSLFGRFNPPAKSSAFNPSTKQAHFRGINMQKQQKSAYMNINMQDINYL